DEPTPRSSEGYKPGDHRIADVCAVTGQDNDAVGPVLPPHPQSDRRPRSSQGDRAQVGVFGLPDAQVRPRVRNAVDGRVRGQGEGQHLEVAEAEGGGAGLPTQSAAHAIGEWIEAVAIARQACGHAQRGETKSSGISSRYLGAGGIIGVFQHSSQKQPPRSRPTERTKRGSSWGGHSRAWKSPSLALQACQYAPSLR